MKARDIMTTDVVTVAPDATVERIAALLLKHRISAVPVAQDRAVIGIVSEGDLMHRPESDSEHTRSWWLRLLTSAETQARDYAKSHGRRAVDVMTRHVVSVTEDTPVGNIASLLERQRIKRVPVMREGRIVGIVSRADLLRALAASGPKQLAGPGDDHAIHAAILTRAQSQPWSDVTMLNVVVHDGDVELWGTVPSDAQREAMRILAEGVPGVHTVQDHLTVMPHWAYAS
jgi:CBS-domain-containing membrane protein